MTSVVLALSVCCLRFRQLSKQARLVKLAQVSPPTNFERWPKLWRDWGNCYHKLLLVCWEYDLDVLWRGINWSRFGIWQQVVVWGSHCCPSLLEKGSSEADFASLWHLAGRWPLPQFFENTAVVCWVTIARSAFPEALIQRWESNGQPCAKTSRLSQNQSYLYRWLTNSTKRI